MGIKNVFKWRVTTNKYLYLVDEENQAPFILDKKTGDRIYPQPMSGSTVTGTTVVTGMSLDEGLISQSVSNIKNADVYSEKYDKMVKLASFDSDTSKLTFLEYDKYFNLDGDECVEEAVTPKCEGYEPVFNVSAYTLPNSGETEVEYTFYAERNESDKTLRYNLELGIPRGEKGEKGDDGAGCKGEPGEPGLPAIIDNVSATIRALDPDEQPDVKVVSSSTQDNKYDLQFNFKIPRGEQGVPGDEGQQGEDGIPARLAYVGIESETLLPSEDAYVQIKEGSYEIEKVYDSEEGQEFYDTSFILQFGLPQGLQGIQGEPGRNAEIRNVTVSRVETIEPGYWYPNEEDPNREWIWNNAQAGVEITPIGGGNVVDLAFWFIIPRGEKGDKGADGSGGGGGWMYNFMDPQFIPTPGLEEPIGDFDVRYYPSLGTADVTLQIYYPEDWGGGGKKCRGYVWTESTSEGGIMHLINSFAEGDIETTEGTNNQPIATGYRSHAEGQHTKAIGQASHAEGVGIPDSSSFISASIRLTDRKNHINFDIDPDTLPDDFEPYISMFNGANITVGEHTYQVFCNEAGGGGWYEDHCELLSYDYIVTENGVTVTDPDILNTLVGEIVTFRIDSENPNAIGVASHTEGNGCQTNGDYSHAEGNGTRANGVASHAEGAYTQANGDYSHAGGFGTISEGTASYAGGYNNGEDDGSTIKASGEGSHAEGYAINSGKIITNENGSFANGYAGEDSVVRADGVGSHAEGCSNDDSTIMASNYGSHAEGYAGGNATIQADGYGAFAEGFASGGTIYVNGGSGAYARGCVSSGGLIQSDSDGAHAEGYAAENGTIKTNGTASFAHGYTSSDGIIQTTINGYGAHAEGFADGSGSTIQATSPGAYAEGYANNGGTIYANSDGAYASGYVDSGGTIEASGNGAHAEGYAEDGGSIIQASGSSAYARGCVNDSGLIQADGDGAHAEGYAAENGTIEANGTASFAHGYTSSDGIIQTTNYGAYARGYADNGGTIKASGEGAHAEGFASGGTLQASGDGAHAEGFNTIANGFASHAEGIGYPGERHDVDNCVLSSIKIYGLSTTCDSNIFIDEKFEKVEIYIIGSKFEYNGIIYTVTNADSSYQPENTHTTFTNVRVKDEDGNEINISELLNGYGRRQDIVLSGVTVDEQQNAIGAASHTENNLTVAEGDYSHAEGNETRANGVGSHAEGCFSEANGDYSHAAGLGTIANNDYMTAIGKFNNSGTTSGDLFVIGNGTDGEHRSNVLSVNGSTKKITLDSDGGIKREIGGSNTEVWNTNGGITDISGIGGGGRAIQINSNQILSSGSTTPLNLSGGTGISISGDTSGLVTITSTASPSPGESLPVGSIQMYAGSTAPDGWLLCTGQTIVKSTMTTVTTPDLKNPIYDNLYDMLPNDPYGSVIKNIPDFSGRFPLGVGNSGTNGSTSHTLYDKGGEEKHTLSISEMPSHTHTYNTYRIVNHVTTGTVHAVTTETTENDNEGFTNPKGGVNGNTTSHNNMPPYFTINFIIKY